MTLLRFFFFLAEPRGLQDLSSLTRDPGIDSRPPAAEAWSPNHWTAREFPTLLSFLHHLYLSRRYLNDDLATL